MTITQFFSNSSIDRLPTGLDYLQGGGSRVSRAWGAQTDPGMAGVLTFFGDGTLHFCESMMANVTNVNEFEAQKKKMMRFFFGSPVSSFLFTNFDVMGFHPPRRGLLHHRRCQLLPTR